MKRTNTSGINLLLICLISGFNIGLAQDSLSSKMSLGGFEETIITDRPDQSEAPQITPRGFFQVEIGSQKEYDYDHYTGTRSEKSLLNTTLWKYGINKNFECRLVTEYATDQIRYIAEDSYNDTVINIQGFNPVSVGTKIVLQKENGIIPNVSLLTHLELPYFGSDSYKPNSLVPRFRFLFSHTLNDKISFSYNLGAEWADDTKASTGIYTVSLGIALFKNLNMFIESYGFLNESDKPDNRLDSGFTYLLGSNVQLDCSGGIGLSDISPDYFVSGGISFRINTINKETRNNLLR